MAKEFIYDGIETNETIKASQVSQSVDAFTGAVAYDITISGSLELTGSLQTTGHLLEVIRFAGGDFSEF